MSELPDLNAEFEQSMYDLGYDKQQDGSYIHCDDGDVVSRDQALLERSEYMQLRISLLGSAQLPDAPHTASN